MAQVLLEICCGSIDDAIEAEKGGADRVELCSALFLGGLTPSVGTIQEAKRRLKVPVMVMVRPRGGGFAYSEAEMASMERDTEAAVENGADGIVVGILQSDGKVDVARCHRIRRLEAHAKTQLLRLAIQSRSREELHRFRQRRLSLNPNVFRRRKTTLAPLFDGSRARFGFVAK